MPGAVADLQVVLLRDEPLTVHSPAMALTRENVLAFLGRDWVGARVRKDRDLAARLRKGGAAAAVRFQDRLREHADFKTRTTREEDFEAHLALVRLLQQANKALTERRLSPRPRGGGKSAQR